MIEPLQDRVLVKMNEREEVTKSGLILTTNEKESSQIATVIKVGTGGMIDGIKVEMLVRENDKVLINRYQGIEIKYENTEYIIVKQNDILAIIK